MGLLIRSVSPARRRAAFLLASAAIVLAVVGVSCTSAPLRFPHVKHVSKPFMGCGMCHDATQSNAGQNLRQRMGHRQGGFAD